MGSRFLWNVTRNVLTCGLIGLTISDRYAGIAPVRGLSMVPTFNSGHSTSERSFKDDRVLVTKFCLEKYKFTEGDIVVYRSPNDYKEKQIKRIIALEGDWINVPNSFETLKIPRGHCWVEGDNPTNSVDSRSFGPIPLALIEGKVTHIIWPPQRVGKVEKILPEGRLISY
ncbi:hypothetical protein AQUCO_04500051v1 [Aquilegia coerulea]|uniref:Mitochondrial inner membrane protease subunit 2 n=1 Tax=Aquilegia coerulea TaxID=218851 RepID=A0A2G5CLM4_AQUCA|nr:hypothetical protein AQUCO_04500051v1 [Aquilegia coerulea]